MWEKSLIYHINLKYSTSYVASGEHFIYISPGAVSEHL